MMTTVESLQLGRLLRRRGPPELITDCAEVQIDDERLTAVLRPEALLMCLYDGTLHGEGPVWQATQDRLLWSDVPNRRLLGWHPDGHVEVVIDGTYFINGNALDSHERILHCEHGRRCISRSDQQVDDAIPQPIITHYQGKRLNSPNDLTVAADGAIWFTDPTFGILMPNQGSVVDPELDHRSVYRFDERSGALHRMADFEQPNGLGFSPDGCTLYVSDTSLSLDEIPGLHATGKKHEIVAFDVGEDGVLSNRRFFCHADHGCPDGFLVDKRGWIWTTAADGIHIWSPQQERLGFVPTPAVASNCALGGIHGRRLFIAATRYLLAIDLMA